MTSPAKKARDLVADHVERLSTGVVVELKWTSTAIQLTSSDDGRVALQLADAPSDDAPRYVDEQGNAGIQGYTSAGYATNKDRNSTYAPYRARGIGRDFGLYHQAWLESQAYQDGWGKIEQGLVTSHWHVKPAEVEAAALADYTRRQAKAVQRVLFGIDGGWPQHVREALYCLVGGFSPFIRLRDGFGTLRALAFRYPSQTRQWITDEYGARPLGIEFDGGDSGQPYVRMDKDLLVYRFRALGNDFEGVSPMRSVLIYIEAHRLFQQLEALAAEKYGAPTLFVERPVGHYDKKDDDALVAIFDAFVAADNPVILLPGGYKATLASPSGQIPDFEPVKRYCDEKIATILAAEGALVGLNGKGAYNLAEIKDDQQLRALAYYAKLICETVNSTSPGGAPSLIAEIVASLTNVDGEDLSRLVEGALPELAWALSPDQDDSDLPLVFQAVGAGALTLTSDDEVWLREKLKMQPRVAGEVEAERAAAPVNAPAAPEPPAAPDAPAAPAGDPAADLSADAVDANPEAAAVVESGGKVADAALNGAQIASAIQIIKSVKIGEIDLRSGVEIIKMAFLVDEARALALLNASSAAAPGVETTPPTAPPTSEVPQ